MREKREPFKRDTISRCFSFSAREDSRLHLLLSFDMSTKAKKEDDVEGRTGVPLSPATARKLGLPQQDLGKKILAQETENARSKLGEALNNMFWSLKRAVFTNILTVNPSTTSASAAAAAVADVRRKQSKLSVVVQKDLFLCLVTFTISQINSDG